MCLEIKNNNKIPLHVSYLHVIIYNTFHIYMKYISAREKQQLEFKKYHLEADIPFECNIC